MGGSVGSVSFEHNLHWATVARPDVLGAVNRAMDGSVIAWKLDSPPDPEVGLHTFRFVWEPLSTVEDLRDLAANSGIVNINPGDGMGTYEGFFPPGAQITANLQPSPGDNEEAGVADNEGTDLDIFSGEFEFFITG